MALPELMDPSPDLAAFGGNAEAALEELKDHLLIAPAAVWLDVVRRCDVGRHYDLLVWMTDQPECDGTIAQLIFYSCKPALMIERRITIDPAYPNHDALCRIVAENVAEGRYPHHENGLIPGELDSRITALAGVLDYVDPEDRVFEVPPAFLTVPEQIHIPLEDVWLAEEDEVIRALYEANGLTVISAPQSAPSAPAPGLVGGIVESIVSLVRRPKRV